MNTEISPPVETKKDKLLSLLKVFVSAIPVAGSPLVEAINGFFMAPLDKRKQQWMEKVAEILEELVESRVDLDSLAENDKFIDAVLTVNNIALRTSEEDKLNYLKVVVINLTKDETVSLDEQQIILSILENISSNQIKVLLNINNRSNIIETNLSTNLVSVRSEMIKACSMIKEFNNFEPKEMLQLIIGDLIDKGFLDCYEKPRPITGRTTSSPIILKVTTKSELLIKFLKQG